MASPRILILEDDEIMRSALAEVLEDEGYQVTAVGRGEQAVQLAREQPFELIVTDIRMDGMDGLQALEQVKRHRPEVGSLVVSGYASEEETLRAVRLNVGGYLKKPFPIEDFLGQVRDQLGRLQRTAVPGPTLPQAVAWALESLARLTDRAALLGPRGELLESAELAERMATHLGLPEPAQIRLGTLLLGLRELPEVQPPEALLGDLAAWLRDEPSPGRRLAAFAQRVTSLPRPHGEWPAVDEVAAGCPQDEDLLVAYAAVQSRPAPEPGPERSLPDQDPGRLNRGLLGLAQVLEQGGDLTSAEQAYREVIARQPATREVWQAWLGLAGLELRRGRGPEAVVQMALQAPEAALPWGPVSHAAALLETGLLLYQAGSGRAREILEAAALALARLEQRLDQALACVALARLGSASARQWLDQAMALLLEPGHAGEVAQATPWLLPALLELAREETFSEPLLAQVQRLVLRHAGQLARMLARGDLDEGCREQVLLALERSRHRPGELLRRLREDPEPHLRQRALRLEQPAEEPPSLLRLRSLGAFEVYRAEEKVPDSAWKSQKNKLLLAYLVSQPGRMFPEESLVEEFWPSDSNRGKRNLYEALSIVRRCLRLPGRESAGPETIVREQDRLGFNWELAHWHDLEELEKAAEAGLRAPGEACLPPLRRVARLFSGSYLEGSYLDWALRRREEIEGLVMRCLSRLAHTLCQQRHYQEALEYAGRALAIDPCSQEAHLLKMRSHLGLGQPEAVIRQYQACERLLQKELGLEPNTELVEVYVRARHGLPDASA